MSLATILATIFATAVNVVVGPAQPVAAADMMVKSSALALKQCLSYGPGFYYLPGSDTCLHVGGFVRAEGYFNTYNNYPIKNDKYYSISTGAAIFDARTDTEFGTLRSYLDLRMLWRSAYPWSDGPNGQQIDAHYMYIQLAGFTFGRLHSIFDFYADADIYGTDPGIDDDDTRPVLAAYTMQFSKAFSATVSVEDPAAHRNAIRAANPTLPGLSGTANYIAGQQLPNLVGALVATGDWGTAQLSGALQQVRGLNALNQFAPADEAVGWAVQAGVKLNLPTGAGDHLYLQGAYADGASSYLEILDPQGDYTPPDAFVGPAGLTTVTGWNAMFSFLHNWNDKWATALYGSYAAFDFNVPAAPLNYGASGGTNYELGGNIAFTPVKNLTFVVQYEYEFAGAADYWPSAKFAPAQENVGASQLLLYVERDF